MKTITRTFYVDHNGQEHTTPESCAVELCELELGRELNKFERDILLLYKQNPKAFREIVESAESYVKEARAIKA